MKKKNDQIQFCVDFRNLNKACPKNEFPLPNISLLANSTIGSSMFSFMDGYNRYNQIKMATKDTEKTAFRMLMTSHNTQLQLNLLSTTNLIYIILIIDLQIAFTYPPSFRN